MPFNRRSLRVLGFRLGYLRAPSENSLVSCLWDREKNIAAPPGLALFGQIAVCNWEKAYLSVNAMVALHRLPLGLLMLAQRATLSRRGESLDRLALLLLALLSMSCAVGPYLPALNFGYALALAAVPVLLASQFPQAGWVKAVRRFSWPAFSALWLGLVFLGLPDWRWMASPLALTGGLVLGLLEWLDGRPGKGRNPEFDRRLKRFFEGAGFSVFGVLLFYGSAGRTFHGIPDAYLGIGLAAAGLLRLLGVEFSTPEATWPFADPPDLAVLATKSVMDGAWVCRVSRDSDDGT